MVKWRRRNRGGKEEEDATRTWSVLKMQLKTDSEFTSIEWRVASVFCGLLHADDDAPGTMTPLEVVPSTTNNSNPVLGNQSHYVGRCSEFTQETGCGHNRDLAGILYGLRPSWWAAVVRVSWPSRRRGGSLLSGGLPKIGIFRKLLTFLNNLESLCDQKASPSNHALIDPLLDCALLCLIVPEDLWPSGLWKTAKKGEKTVNLGLCSHLSFGWINYNTDRIVHIPAHGQMPIIIARHPPDPEQGSGMREWRCTFGKSKQNDDNDKNLCDLSSSSVRSSCLEEQWNKNLIDRRKTGMDLQRCEILSQVRWTWLMM